MRRILAACLAGLAIATLARPSRRNPPPRLPVAACPDGAVAGRVFPMSIGGNHAGFHRECRLADGAGLYLFAFNDRGRGPSVRSRIVQDAAGIPTAITVEGNDYLKNAIASASRSRTAARRGEQGRSRRAQARGSRVLPEPVGHAGGASDARERGARRARDARLRCCRPVKRARKSSKSAR